MMLEMNDLGREKKKTTCVIISCSIMCQRHCVVVPVSILQRDGDVNLFSLSGFYRQVFDTFCSSRFRFGCLDTGKGEEQKRDKEHLDLRLSSLRNHYSVQQQIS